MHEEQPHRNPRRPLLQRGRTGLLALLLSACGHPSAAPAPVAPPAPPPPAPPTATAAAPLPAAPARPLPPLAGGGPRAYVTDATGLVEVAAPGGSQVVVPGAIDWCNADARAGVVWFRRQGDLFAFDLTDRKVHAVLTAPLPSEVDTVVIDWGNQQLGGESKVDFQLAVALRLDGTPAVGGLVGCDGDRGVYCYEAAADGGRALHEDLAAALEEAGTLRFADPDYAATLARRGEQKSLWSPPPAPPLAPPRKPRVDRSGCDEYPAQCGSLKAIPGSLLWLVQTGNSRGDFYHESWSLWSPATGQFLDVAEGKVARHDKASSDGPEYDGLRASTSGVLSYRGVVFDGETVYYAPSVGETCGWSDGGWRVGGPRG